jgi:glycosyltransferase involved in cell wall biosynthesis
LNILWLPHAPWHLPQRARFFSEALAENHTVWATDWDGDFANFRTLFSKRYLLNTVPRRWQEKGVFVKHVPRVAPALFSRRLRQLNSNVYRQTLDRLIVREKIDVVVGCFVAPVPEGIPTVTDIFDDNVGLWLAYGRNKAYAQEIEASETAWIRQSRYTVTVSSVLEDRFRTLHPNTSMVHIPNGVDLNQYKPDRQAARRSLGLSPTATYIGNIGALDKREEAERVLEVAAALRQQRGLEVLVVGRGAAMSYLAQSASQRGLSNVRVVGFVTGQTLVAYFQALDIGLCPYEETPGDAARVPLRLLHYSAVGARVVCTRLEEVERMNFENVLLSNNDKVGFAATVTAALDMPANVPPQITHYAMATLTKRYEDVLSAALKA